MSNLVDSLADEQFIELVANSYSYAECLTKLGYLSKTGVVYKQLQARIELLKIDTSHFIASTRTERTRENVFVENSDCDQGTLRRWFLKENVPYECNICGQKPLWNGHEMIMILDHINGKNHDNRLNNLRWVCPNCNSQLSTNSGKNIRQKQKEKIIPLIQVQKKTKYDAHPSQRYECPICKSVTSIKDKLCRQCTAKRSRKVERPSAIEFARMVKELGFTKVGEIYGLSGRAVQKWCKSYAIPTHRKELSEWYDEQIRNTQEG